MIFNRRSLLLLASTALLSSSVFAAPTDPAAAKGFIEQKQKALMSRLSSSAEPKNDPVLLKLFDELIDFSYFAEESLGSHWAQLSEAQQKQFSDVLSGLIRASYRKNLHEIRAYRVEYLNVAGGPDAEGAVVVPTKASDPANPRKEALRIDYRVAHTPKGFRVRDITTGGVSLLTNYRRQFGRIIKKTNFDALLQKMETQLQKLESSIG